MLDIFSKISVDTSDPVQIALRSRMKGDFLEAFARYDHKVRCPDTKIVVYGSTLMRQLALHEGVRFPLGGLKSSDIDIGIRQKPGISDLQYFKTILEGDVAPLIRQSVVDTHYDMSYVDQGHMRFKHAKDIPQLDPDYFIGDFLLFRTFTEQEVIDVISQRRDADKIMPYVGEGAVTVSLIISVNDKPFPLLLDPMVTKTQSGEGEFNRTVAMDMLAGKLVRCMMHSRKPTDLIDIYNLIKAKRENTGKFFINMDSDAEDYRADVIRALIVCYFPMSRGLSYDRENVLDSFNPANSQKFLEEVRGQISAAKFGRLKERVDEVFDTINNFIATVMCKKSDVSYGPLNFTPGERDFMTGIDGYVLERTPVAQDSRFKRMLRGEFSAAMPVFTDVRKPVRPHVNVEILQRELPKAFRQYPTLAVNIAGNPILSARIDENIGGPQFGNVTPGDF